MSTRLTDVSFPPAPRGMDASMDPDFGAALAQCALAWRREPDETAILEAITADTPGLLRGADAAAVVSVSTSGKLLIRAADGPIELMHSALPRTLEPTWWTAGQPSQQAGSTGRWPVSATLDHHAEMGSMICAPLGSGQMMFGTLLVLGFAIDAFTQRSTTDATTLAIHASIALAAHRERRQLEEAVASRDVIGQAKGILMHQRQLTEAQAFAQLLRASQQSNIKLRKVSEDLCRTGELINRQPDR